MVGVRTGHGLVGAGIILALTSCAREPAPTSGQAVPSIPEKTLDELKTEFKIKFAEMDRGYKAATHALIAKEAELREMLKPLTDKSQVIEKLGHASDITAMESSGAKLAAFGLDKEWLSEGEETHYYVWRCGDMFLSRFNIMVINNRLGVDAQQTIPNLYLHVKYKRGKIVKIHVHYNL
ncbi:hypothetical protein LBMAG53_06170 [Planctomycetota bacterium]|nr:hypothetical protein LBMAG53_06170 [Planctomycetota bacterium]